MHRLVLDEMISPRVAVGFWEQNVDAIHLRDRDMLSVSDRELWRYANADKRIVVTINVRDFRKLAANDKMHCGLIGIPSGYPPNVQFSHIMSVLAFADENFEPPLSIANRVFCLSDDGKISVEELFDRGNLQSELLNLRRSAGGTA